jgi:hypothetical protein
LSRTRKEICQKIWNAAAAKVQCREFLVRRRPTWPPSGCSSARNAGEVSNYLTCLAQDCQKRQTFEPAKKVPAADPSRAAQNNTGCFRCLQHFFMRHSKMDAYSPPQRSPALSRFLRLGSPGC